MNHDSERTRSLTARTQTGLKWSSLATITQALLAVLILSVLSRLLSPTDFGLYGIALIFVGFAETAIRVGIGPSVVQRIELTDQHTEVAFTISVVIGAVMAVGTWLLAPVGGTLFNEPIVSKMLRTMSVVLAIIGVEAVPDHLLRRHLRFRNLMMANLLSQVIGGGLTAIVLALLGFGGWSLIWGKVIHHAVYTLTLLRCMPLSLRPRLAVREAIDLLNYSTGIVLSWVFYFIAQQGPSFIIGRYLGTASLGYYTRAWSLLSLPLRFHHALRQVLFPALSARQRQTNLLRVVYLHSIEILLLAAVPVVSMLFIGSPEIVAIILGEQWNAVVLIIQIFALASLFFLSDAINLPLIRAIGATYGEAWRQAVFALLAVAGAWLGSHWGLGGVTASVLGALLAVHVLLTQLVLSLLGLRWGQLLRCHLPMLWAGACVTPVLWLTAQQARAVSLPAWLSLVIECLACIAAFVLAVYFSPRFARPRSIGWVLKNVHFDALGAPGHLLHNALARMERCPLAKETPR